ncbi:DNA repair protein SWI5 homolog [Sardina pilchardus]|uniref:DNA repair protein SWI5 homolog n=1 Tax=Sardina pilchardus TaxID=27697 RepID=UPI002E13E298
MESESRQEVTAKCNVTPRRGGLTSRNTLGRTPCSGGRRVNSSFKSPVQSVSSSQALPEREVEELKKKRDELDSQITLLQNEGMDIQELDQHIDLLHEYNDIKDIGQTLLGQLATLRGVTTRDLYSLFDLELDD